MRVTRSRGKAEKWVAEEGIGSSSRELHAIVPTESSRISSQIEVVQSPRTLREAHASTSSAALPSGGKEASEVIQTPRIPREAYASTSSAPFGESTLPSGGREASSEVSPLVCMDLTPARTNIEERPDGPPERPIVMQSPGSKKSSGSKRQAREARREVLRIKLELAQLALEDAESDHSEYEYDGKSKTSYVHSWIENSEDAMPCMQPSKTQILREEEGSRNPQPTPSYCMKPECLNTTHRQGTETTTIPHSHQNFVRYSEDLPLHTKLRHPLSEIDELKKEIELLKKTNVLTTENKAFRPMSSGLTEAPTVYRKPILTNSPSSSVASRVIMDLPAYSGALNEWLSYRAIYENTKEYFNDVENTARIRRSLTGKALAAVDTQLIAHSKPDAIIEELEMNFGRPDTIAYNEYDKLRALPRCADTPKEIHAFASKVRSALNLFRALKLYNFITAPDLMRVLREKLPSSLCTRWYEEQACIVRPDLTNFSEFLTKQAACRTPYAPIDTLDIATNRRMIHRTFTTTEDRRQFRIPKKDLGERSIRETNSARCRICFQEWHPYSKCPKFQAAKIDERWELAKQHKLCFRCLQYRRPGHTCKPKKCRTDGCNTTHHRLLHYVKKEAAQNSANTEEKETVATTWLPSKPQAYLKIIPVRVKGPAGEISTYALLDDGSTVSLIDETLAQEVGAEGRLDPFKIEAIGNVVVDTPKSRRVSLSLASTCRNSNQVHFKARTIPRLRLSSQTVGEEDLAGCKHLLDLKEQLLYESATPKILIGQDNWNLLLAEDVRRGPNSQPVASLTPLGWVLHGAHTRILGQQVHYVHNLSDTKEEYNMDHQLQEYFALESLIINPRRPESDPEKKAETILREHTHRLVDGHIETALLWKTEDFTMPNNYETAFKRLVSIERKLDRDPELKTRYNEQMESLLQKGYAEKAPKSNHLGKTWYLPHFDVRNPTKPDKLRIVHDAAAKTKGVSLNDFLLTGPDLLQSLPGVMMRFRRHSIALSADIAEMFMQVKVRTQDRDALRYLWRGNRRDGAPEEYRMTSIIFGAASSPCTAIYAKDWNAKRHIKSYPEAVEAIIENHYMDDYLDSFRTIEEATEVAKKVRQIHSEACFELRKWVSNDESIVKELEPQSDSTETVNLGCKEEKILGLMWRPLTDELRFNLKLVRLPADLLEKKTPTKREALKIVMSLYDPLGFASPVTIRAKRILQETWRRAIDWDHKLDDDLACQWREWMQHLQNLKNVSLPRCYPGFSNATSLQVHVFSDASESAYAAVVYWRVVAPDGQVHVSMVMAKAKVAPLKITSIPRLELQAAVMGSRMATAVIKEHRVIPQTKTFWTDSKTVLTWVKKGARSYKPFVAHRVAAIEEHSKVEEWRWVPSKLNIADIATREVPADFGPDHEWYRGPAYLKEDPCVWPTEKLGIIKPTGEERTFIVTEIAKDLQIKEAIPDPRRFSRWERLLRASARVLQFLSLCRKTKEKIFYKRNHRKIEKDPIWKKKQNTTLKKSIIGPSMNSSHAHVLLEADFIRKAEILLIRACQKDSFKEDIADLKSSKTIAKQSRLFSLPVELRDDIVVLRSRITAVQEVNEEMIVPPILDGDHRITQLYIEWTHRCLHHASTESIVNEVRQHYWVLRLRPVAKKIISQCLSCRIRKAQPPEPVTGDHPKSRLAHHQRPFTYTGLDYFGPLFVTVGRQHQKRYIALFTCLTSRAIHLEIAVNLSADSAILALRRFAARRGCPTEIYSDNGTNMHGADKELRDAFKEEASRRGITWRFITPSAPFMGGAWERLIRCVKTAMCTVLRERYPQEEVLATLLCEVEYTVNSRPLTHVSVNNEDEESITPNHFLLGGSARLPVPGSFDEKDLDCKKHWRRSQILADMFWRRWVHEYLPELQYRREPHGRGPLYNVGDLVLIVDSQLPRNTWPRGRIERVYPGADGQVRIVEVRTKGGLLKRPTKKLVPLPN